MRAAAILRYARDALVFAPCYVALDWASYIDPVGPFNITPWNPQPALAIVWMQLAGLHHALAVFATIVLADIVVRHAPGGYAVTVVTALALATGYAAIAWVLRSTLQPDRSLNAPRQLALFAVIVLGGSAIVATGFVGVLRATGVLGGSAFASAAFRFWVGDAVGILVTAPLLLAVADSERRRSMAALARKPETYLQLGVLMLTLWLIFRGLGGEPTRFFYLLFVPLIWIAIRGGLDGAVFATLVVQLGVVLGIHQGQAMEIAALELQALVAALTLTGLFLGVMVDERERATDALRQSLRLAAAGEMAGAIAHEVNQPLTALANYGQSARTLLSRGGEALAQLPGLMDKILRETERAAEIVRRLRDFFRAGTTRLEPVAVDVLLAAARAMAERLIGARAISLQVAGAQGLPQLLVDRLQLELVLRNLIANAIDSLEAQSTGEKRLSIAAQPGGANHVCVIIADSGAGPAPNVRERLFEPFVSGKASGMGLGLAVSRAIVEAHGGTLEAVKRDHGEFRLLLPTVGIDD